MSPPAVQGAVPEPRRRASSRVLISREAEIADLEAAFGAVCREAVPETLLVEGPAGIGKTRLLSELAARVVARGGDALVGHCLPLGGDELPYAPLAEVLADLVRRAGADRVLGWAGAAGPELSRLVPTLLPSPGPERPARAHAVLLLQGFCEVVRAASHDRPLLLAVEDVHWADPSTRELLTLATQQLRGRVLLVLTMRTDEPPQDPGLVRFLAELGRRRTRRVSVPPLTRPEQALQLSDILGVPPSRSLLEDVYGRAEGNPFFAEELLALSGAGELPATVRDLLLTRLELLPPAARQMLRTAAVVGRRVPHGLLDRVSDVRGTALDGALRTAVGAHVLVTDAGGYHFRHALLQEAVAATLLPGEAARLHRRVAEALTDDPELAGNGRTAAALAWHWFAAGDGGRALLASLEAGRQGRDDLAFAEALGHYERAVELLATVPDADRLLPEPRYRLLWAAAETAHLSGAFQRALELVRAAIGVVDPDRPDHRGYLHERLGRYLWMAADSRAAEAEYTRAVELVPEQPPTRWRAAVMSGYAQFLMLTGGYPEAVDWARRAIDLAGELPGCRSIEGHARNNLGVALARLGDYDAGVEELLTARRIAEEEFDDVDDIGRAIVNLNAVHLDAGRVAEAAQVCLDGVEVVDRLGLARRKGAWCRCDAAQALIPMGRHDEALVLLDQAAALEPGGIDAVRLDSERGFLLLRTGRLEAARQHLERARRSSAGILDGHLVGPVYARLVECAAWQGDLDAAHGHAEEGARRLRAGEDAAFSVPVYAAAVLALVELGRLEPSVRGRALSETVTRADVWLERSRLALEATPMAPLAEAVDALARCERDRLAGQHEPDSWDEVRAQWLAVQDPARAAYAGLRAAQARLTRRTGRRQAEDLVRDCRAVAARLDLRQVERLARDLAARAGFDEGAPAHGPADRFHLTRREREVLALVADGLTDRVIGERLFISHRTVERHVSSLLAKLDAGRRAELAALAHRLGLVDARP